MKADVCIIPPNSFALARTIEYFRIPRDILTICLGKSTYARCGIIVNVTPFEPEWEGHVTIEISNNKVIAVRQEVRVSANEAREEWVVRELWKKKYVTNERSFREKEPQKTK